MLLGHRALCFRHMKIVMKDCEVILERCPLQLNLVLQETEGPIHRTSPHAQMEFIHYDCRASGGTNSNNKIDAHVLLRFRSCNARVFDD